jgi:FKBP12-rapamycin complex-associated protein
MHRDKYPEKIPFRLTRMLTNAMEVSGIEGNFRSSCESVMHVLRSNSDSLMAMLEAFVHDPLINWRLLGAGAPAAPSPNSTSNSTTSSPSEKTAGAAAAGAAGAAAAAAGGEKQPPSETQQQPAQNQSSDATLPVVKIAVVREEAVEMPPPCHHTQSTRTITSGNWSSRNSRSSEGG